MVNKLTVDNKHVQESLSQSVREGFYRHGDAAHLIPRTKSRRPIMTQTSKLSLALISGLSAFLLLASPASARGGGYYNEYPAEYNNSRYDNNNSYNNYNNYDDGDYYRERNYRGRSCSKGTGGTIIGAVAGGLLGRTVVRRGGDRTAGTIIGAGVGALAGRAIDKSGSRRC
jgi:Glycine zipper 2TM domain